MSCGKCFSVPRGRAYSAWGIQDVSAPCDGKVLALLFAPTPRTPVPRARVAIPSPGASSAPTSPRARDQQQTAPSRGGWFVCWLCVRDATQPAKQPALSDRSVVEQKELAREKAGGSVLSNTISKNDMYLLSSDCMHLGWVPCWKVLYQDLWLQITETPLPLVGIIRKLPPIPRWPRGRPRIG